MRLDNLSRIGIEAVAGREAMLPLVALPLFVQRQAIVVVPVYEFVVVILQLLRCPGAAFCEWSGGRGGLGIAELGVGNGVGCLPGCEDGVS